jgi:hypothetical protein
MTDPMGEDEAGGARANADEAGGARANAVAALAIVAAAAVLRVLGGWNDLWLDEIWSLELAREVSRPSDVFLRLHHEINHYLNTLWLWSAGSRGNWFGYRVPALLAGIATVAVAGAVPRERGAARIFTMLVVAGSYVLVLYSSEIRGYAGLVLFAYLSLLLLRAHLRRGDLGLGAAYACAACAGLLSHVLFASVVLSGVAWSAWEIGRRRAPLRTALALGACHALPLAALAALYVADIRWMEVGGGGASGSLVADYGTALAFALGAPVSSAAQLIGCVAAVLVIDLGVRLVRRSDPGEALFYLGAIVVFPLLLAVVRGSPVIYVRHFLLPIAFVLLLLGSLLGALWQRGPRGRAAAAALLAGYGIANAAHLRELFASGRGENAAALRFVLAGSPPGPVSIGADDDWRIQRVVAFHGAEVPGGERIRFETRSEWDAAGPAWLIVNRDAQELPLARGEEIRDAAGRRFGFVRAFPAAPLAGLHWFVYRNLAR